ncbi:WG repeat-containing protein [Longitalea arenae]|uniref:WG repeat-containing protein n=1 Tax=Longitalea arenae TaxID=2812558 RepID=UPI0019675DDA|nr:WG repeat-containing protein [Longitalea arenae]
MYNLLPQNILSKYAITYSELVYQNITIFKNKDGKWGVIAETAGGSFDILLKPIYHSVGFNRALNYIEGVKYENTPPQERYYFFDISGKLKGKSKRGTTITIDSFGNLLIIKSDFIGALDQRFRVIIPPSYEFLHGLRRNIFKAKRNGLFGIIDINENVLLDFQYKNILSSIKDSGTIVQNLSNDYFSFNLDTLQLKPLNVDRILLATSNTYQAPSFESPLLYKAIIHCQETEFDWYDNDMSQYTGLWGILRTDGSTMLPIEYAYVDPFRNPNFFKVARGRFSFEYNVEQNRLSAKGVKWGVVDCNNNVIVPIEYDWIEEVEDTVWVVNQGGTVFFSNEDHKGRWVVKGGKLGVYNMSRLVTPIVYDAIRTNWYRIKDFIFIQKGRASFNEQYEYDVYTLHGEKIEENKPLPKHHTYYKGA